LEDGIATKGIGKFPITPDGNLGTSGLGTFVPENPQILDHFGKFREAFRRGRNPVFFFAPWARRTRLITRESLGQKGPFAACRVVKSL
jgi:hypothetical protein